MPLYPTVVDPDAPTPHAVHIRSTVFGQAWPRDVPAFCGVAPRDSWLLSTEQATCAACVELVSSSSAWKSAIVPLVDGLLLVL